MPSSNIKKTHTEKKSEIATNCLKLITHRSNVNNTFKTHTLIHIHRTIIAFIINEFMWCFNIHLNKRRPLAFFEKPQHPFLFSNETSAFILNVKLKINLFS